MTTFRTSAYLIGLDLGQKKDYTALTMLQQFAVPTDQTVRAPVAFDLNEGLIFDDVPTVLYTYHLTHADRWRGQSYHEVVPKVRTVMDGIRQAWFEEEFDRTGRSTYAEPPISLLVDYTGVGIAVVDSIRAAGLECIGVTIHGGDAITRESHELRVPKRELVGALQVLLQTQRLGISSELALADVLTEELENFRATIKLATGHDTYGAGADWRENNHDDLVLATAMAAWYGEDKVSQPAGFAFGFTG